MHYVDISSHAKVVGFKLPVAIANDIWNSWIVPDETDRLSGESETERLLCFLWILRAQIMSHRPSTGTPSFYAFFKKRGMNHFVPLILEFRDTILANTESHPYPTDKKVDSQAQKKEIVCVISAVLPEPLQGHGI